MTYPTPRGASMILMAALPLISISPPALSRQLPPTVTYNGPAESQVGLGSLGPGFGTNQRIIFENGATLTSNDTNPVSAGLLIVADAQSAATFAYSSYSNGIGATSVSELDNAGTVSLINADWNGSVALVGTISNTGMFSSTGSTIHTVLIDNSGNGTLNVDQNSLLFTSSLGNYSGQITNNGIIYLAGIGQSSASFTNSATINNNGILNISGLTAANSAQTGVINNVGTLTLQSATVGSAGSGVLNNTGSVDIQSGSLIAAQSSNLQSCTAAGCTLSGGSWRLGGALSLGTTTAGGLPGISSIAGGTSVEIDSGGQWSQLSNSLANNRGTLTLAAQSWSFNSGFTNAGGGMFINNMGTAYGSAALTVGASGATFTNSGVIQNNGVLAVNSGFTNTNNATVNNNLVVGYQISGIAFSGSSVNNGAIQNSGNVAINAASQVTGQGIYYQYAGNTSIAATGSLQQQGGVFLQSGVMNVNGSITTPTFKNLGGTLTGSGRVNGNVVQTAGAISVGDPQTLTINGNLTVSGGVIDLQIGGTAAGQYDVLNVAGAANLSGVTLMLDFINGYAPTAGDTVLNMFVAAGGTTGLNTATVETSGLASGFEYQLAEGDSGSLSLVALNTASPVPLPPTLWLLVSGLGALSLTGARRRRSKQPIIRLGASTATLSNTTRAAVSRAGFCAMSAWPPPT